MAPEKEAPMTPFVLFLTLCLWGLVARLYTRATASLAEPGRTIVDCVLILLCTIGFAHVPPIGLVVLHG